MENLIKYKENEYLTLTHYKEPLTPVKEGYGYMGAICASLDGEKIQCHVCGELFAELSVHLRKHKITAREYREKFDLSYTTSLISEKIRNARKMRFIEYYNSLSDEQRADMKRKSRENYKAWMQSKQDYRMQPKQTLETKNKRGTCPQQLLQKIKDCADALKRTPSKFEFIEWCGTQRYVHLIYKTHGSWAKAIEMLGLQPFVRTENGGRRNYSNEELIEYMQIFYQENGKPPTGTDCRRGLIPDSSIYKKRFGSMQAARDLAEIYDEVGNTTRKGIGLIH